MWAQCCLYFFDGPGLLVCHFYFILHIFWGGCFLILKNSECGIISEECLLNYEACACMCTHTHTHTKQSNIAVERLILLDITASAEVGKNVWHLHSRKFVTPCCILLESLEKLDMNYRILLGVETSLLQCCRSLCGK